MKLTPSYRLFCLLLACGWALNTQNAAAEPATNTPTPAALATPAVAAPHFEVAAFTVEGRVLLPTNVLLQVFSKYAGTNVSLERIEQAASDLEQAYFHAGYTNMNIILAPKKIKDGIVTLDAFPGAVAQVVVAGQRYFVSGDGQMLTPNPPPPAAPAPKTFMAGSGTTTNSGPHFTVKKYQVLGNTLLPPQVMGMAVTNAPGAFGTNVSLDGIRAVVVGIQEEYRARGYVTVGVALPPHPLSTNGTLKVQVTEGRLDAILVKGNHYFSSNNVMRAMPGLHTNMILNGITFQSELNRANANQDRQIYPVIEPGPNPGTSDLTLQVKDRLPLHAKLELNNQNSPGTPDLRLNASATYNNLWDLDHSVGLQYGFSPGDFKQDPRWNFYDEPLVANYSAFYRMPLGSPEAIDDEIASAPGTFGYDEATRKFNLPPASGQPELTVYASRSAIDTGVENLSDKVLYNSPGVRTITEADYQQDLTVNDDVGTRWTLPLALSEVVHWNASAGLDFKSYETTSAKTNDFLFDEITVSASGIPNPPIYSTVSSPVPLTYHPIEYLPLTVGLAGTWHGALSTLAWGLNVSGNTFYSGSRSNLEAATGSTKSTGYWMTLNPNFSWQFPIHTNWLTAVRLDGQLASEPLLSTEQFGAGGVNSVRGYQEGQNFGDDGWHATVEQLTPSHTIGMVFGRTPLVVRGSIYMDYAQTYSLVPHTSGVDLWGTGVGCVASIGSFWETRFLFSVPLLNTASVTAGEPFFDFSLTAQF